MGYETITVAEAGGVATIMLNRPEVMNALSARLRVELLEAWRAAEGRARCIVLTGAGRAFCSGQDLQDAMALGSLDLGRVLAEEYEPLLKAIYDCPVPTIAAVNGAAAGAGANLALACDVVIACESASFIQAFTRIGLIPARMRGEPIGCRVRWGWRGRWGRRSLPRRSAPGRRWIGG